MDNELILAIKVAYATGVGIRLDSADVATLVEFIGELDAVALELQSVRAERDRLAGQVANMLDFCLERARCADCRYYLGCHWCEHTKTHIVDADHYFCSEFDATVAYREMTTFPANALADHDRRVLEEFVGWAGLEVWAIIELFLKEREVQS